ncbi:hypothetical protein FM107_17975 [Sphingobacterium sp. JB170]|nr:hypothetical protein FM107_17975 [Sphingobacterium sp. JB170]
MTSKHLSSIKPGKIDKTKTINANMNDKFFIWQMYKFMLNFTQ